MTSEHRQREISRRVQVSSGQNIGIHRVEEEAKVGLSLGNKRHTGFLRWALCHLAFILQVDPASISAVRAEAK